MKSSCHLCSAAAALTNLSSFPPDYKDLSRCGQVWAVMKGPYGRTLALCWSEGAEARVMDVNQNNVFWTLPDSANLWPHDMALGAAAMPLTGGWWWWRC